eukprot:EG_transcript_32547
MSSTQLLDLAMAALVPAGGVLAYVRKGSVPSLVGGVGVGLAYGLAAYLAEEQPNAGYTVGAVASLALSIIGLLRFRKTGKFMPAGLLLVLGVLTTVANGSNII